MSYLLVNIIIVNLGQNVSLEYLGIVEWPHASKMSGSQCYSGERNRTTMAMLLLLCRYWFPINNFCRDALISLESCRGIYHCKTQVKG